MLYCNRPRKCRVFFFEVLFGGGEASTRKEQDFAKPVKQMEDGDDKLVYSE